MPISLEIDNSQTPVNIELLIEQGFGILAGEGDMMASTYDPTSIEGDAFARANHTGAQAISTVTGLQTELDLKAARERLPHVDIRDYGAVATASAPSAEIQSANVVAIQAALDAAGAGGVNLFIAGGSYYINDLLLVKYQGQRIYGHSFHYQVTPNQSRIVQTATDKGVFQVNTGFGSGSSNQQIVFESLRLSGPGSGVSSRPAISFKLDGTGTNFSDLNTIRRIRVDGFRAGLEAVKFSNSHIEQFHISNCYDGIWIGGNCNAVNITSCISVFHPTEGRSIRATGSAQVNVNTYEYGAGGALLGFESGVTGFFINFKRLTVERQEESSVVPTGNSVQARDFRFLSGEFTRVVPFRFEAGAIGQLENDQQSGFKTASSATVTLTIAEPGVVSWTGHGLLAGDRIRFATTGALPTGLVAGTSYFVINPTTNTFEIAETRGGAVINTSGSQSGEHTGESFAIPLAYCVPASIPQRMYFSTSGVAPQPVEIYSGNTFETYFTQFGFNSSRIILDNGGFTASERWRGRGRHIMKRDLLGSNGQDHYEMYLKIGDKFIWDRLNNSALIITNSSSEASITLVLNTWHRLTNASLVTALLPVVARIDDEIKVIAMGAGGVDITQNTSQIIRSGNGISTSGTGGKLHLPQYCSVTLKCTSTNNGWTVILRDGPLVFT